jgi:predicted Rossmann fold flavoprotein
VHAELLIVGAGAAGLWAAQRAAAAGCRVLVLEKTARTGTKILASGGTRCNLTTTLEPEAAGELFGPRGARFLRTALRALPPRALRAQFEQWGVPSEEAPLEKVFPRSGRARDVRDALEGAARAAGARIELCAPVVALERAGGAWCVRLADGTQRSAPRLLLTPGGASYPRSGTEGDGYAWLRALGLPLVEPVPALVPLTSPAPWVHALSGIALQAVRVELRSARGEPLAARARPVVFTHRGISGPGAMDVSEPVARHAAARAAAAQHASAASAAAAAEGPLVLALDLLPEREFEELRELLVRCAAEPGGALLARALPVALGCELPRRLLEAVLSQAGLDPAQARAHALTRAQRHALVQALRGLHVPVDGTAGWDAAEVTAGGLELAALEPGSMRVRGCEGLYAAGEVLDLQGPIGGLNFQAAFACAELAARAAAVR